MITRMGQSSGLGWLQCAYVLHTPMGISDRPCAEVQVDI